MAGQVIWVMGLSGAGKTTLANELTARLRQGGLQPVICGVTWSQKQTTYTCYI